MRRLAVVGLLLSCRVLAVSVMLCACGGGGGSDGGSGGGDDDVNGIWRQPGSGTIGIISDAGWKADFIGAFGHLSGRLLARCGVVYDSAVTSFSGGNIRDVLFATEGTVVTKSAVTVTYDGRFTIPITLDLVYDALSDRPSSLSRIAGIWSRTSGERTITMTTDQSGALFGSDTDGCVHAGNVSVPDSRRNNYRIQLAGSGCINYLQDGRGQGGCSTAWLKMTPCCLRWCDRPSRPQSSQSSCS